MYFLNRDYSLFLSILTIEKSILYLQALLAPKASGGERGTGTEKKTRLNTDINCISVNCFDLPNKN